MVRGSLYVSRIVCGAAAAIEADTVPVCGNNAGNTKNTEYNNSNNTDRNTNQ